MVWINTNGTQTIHWGNAWTRGSSNWSNHIHFEHETMRFCEHYKAKLLNYTPSTILEFPLLLLSVQFENNHPKINIRGWFRPKWFGETSISKNKTWSSRTISTLHANVVTNTHIAEAAAVTSVFSWPLAHEVILWCSPRRLRNSCSR